MRFNMRYSYLERLPTNRPWEIALVSPVFFDSYAIKPPDNTIIVPHEKLTISHKAWTEIMQRD
jgi:hypothetical protein